VSDYSEAHLEPEPEQPQSFRPKEEMRLRTSRPPVMRLSRKVLLGGGIVASGVIVGVLFFALRPAPKQADKAELYNTTSHTTPDKLVNLPKDYTAVPRSVPQLGDPLPGDLGRPILKSGAPAPVIGNPVSANEANPQAQKMAQESEAARAGRLFTQTSSANISATVLPPGQISAPTPPVAAETAVQDHKLAFLSGAADQKTVSSSRLEQPASSYVVQAGSVIQAALITGLRSDLPGQVTAQVTANVFDSPTGKILLIPQGARLIGQYDAQISFGQSRALLVWTRLILPNGRSIVLERQPGADTEGYAGLEDEVDNHWGTLFKAAALSTLLSVGAESGTSNNENDLTQAFRSGASTSFSRIGEQVVGRSLNVPPTITIRPGFPVRVVVTKDLVFESYAG
jgi:type IV secretion system protein VirB10